MPTDSELEAAGLTREDVATSVELWLCNVKPFNLFQSLGTQWRIGMSGPTGLDYAAILVALRLQGVCRTEWPSLFEDIRVMEAAALVAMRAKE